MFAASNSVLRMRYAAAFFSVLFLPLHVLAYSPPIYPACERHGLGSRLNLQTGFCECLFGYALRHNTCLSNDDACKEDFGLGAKGSSNGKCNCRNGYKFNTVGTACVPEIATVYRGPRPGRIACITKRPCVCPVEYNVSGNIACVAK